VHIMGSGLRIRCVLIIRWRWIFWGLSSVQAVIVLMTFLLLPETNAPIILDWRTARLRKEGRKDVISPMETGHTPQQIFTKYLLRPFKVLLRLNKLTHLRCCSAIQLSSRWQCIFTSVPISNSSLMSILYSFIYLLYSTYLPFLQSSCLRLPFVFGRQYQWNETQSGMSYLGMAIGSLAGLFVVYFCSDSVSESMAKKHGVKSPEVVSLVR